MRLREHEAREFLAGIEEKMALKWVCGGIVPCTESWAEENVGRSSKACNHLSLLTGYSHSVTRCPELLSHHDRLRPETMGQF